MKQLTKKYKEERKGRRGGEYFKVKKGLRQICVMSPWLFDVFIDRMVRQVNENVKKKGVKVRKEGGRG